MSMVKVKLSRWYVVVCFSFVLLQVYIASKFLGICLDDAAISFQYAKNLASGYGLTYHQAFEPVEGFSNPIWTGLLSICYALGWQDLVSVSFVMGLIFHLATGLLFCLYGFRHYFPLLILFILYSFPYHTYWSVTGMENASYGFFLCLAYLCVKRELSKSLWLVLALIIFSRPEGFLFAFLFALADTRERRKSLLMSVILVLVLLLLRLIYFQDILPNTIWAKWGLVHSSDPLMNLNLGLRYYWSYFTTYLTIPWVLVPVMLFLLIKRQWLLISIFAVHLMFLLCTGGDWMRGWRFMSPFAPLYCYAIASFLWAVVMRFRVTLLFLLVVLINLLLVLAWTWRDDLKTLQVPYMDVKPRMQRAKMFEEIAAKLKISGGTLLDVDAGGTAFGSNLRVYDMAGLTVRSLAHSKKSPKEVQNFIKNLRPHFIYSTGFWSKIFGLSKWSWLGKNYVPIDSKKPYFDKQLRCVLIRKDLHNKLTLLKQ